MMCRHGRSHRVTAPQPSCKGRRTRSFQGCGPGRRSTVCVAFTGESKLVRKATGSTGGFGGIPRDAAGCQILAKYLKTLQMLEARVGIEPTNKGFADLCLTTWLPRRCCELSFGPSSSNHTALKRMKSIPAPPEGSARRGVCGRGRWSGWPFESWFHPRS